MQNPEGLNGRETVLGAMALRCGPDGHPAGCWNEEQDPDQQRISASRKLSRAAPRPPHPRILISTASEDPGELVSSIKIVKIFKNIETFQHDHCSADQSPSRDVVAVMISSLDLVDRRELTLHPGLTEFCTLQF
ncbi:hypothetical protein P7K49_035046 [Saguinus oedipus]|uniref:Uncharacterized protein n=1 Tax=Saguinus oedipus TaxID=9490 RepID=A0ABQ9TX37_SAGOE|nr:hypothetical protein P7K49_035046 [Saguinus oedipus]